MQTHLAPAPLPVGETGVAKASAAGRRGITRPAQADCNLTTVRNDVRAEGRGNRRGRSRIFAGLHACLREGGALSSRTNKGVCTAAKRRSAGSRETGLKRHPQEGQHSAASWRDPGPSASGERHVTRAKDRRHRPRRFQRRGSREPGPPMRTRPLTLFVPLAISHAAARSSLSAPRATICSTSSGNGRCNTFASSQGARIQTSRSSSVVRITGMALG